MKIPRFTAGALLCPWLAFGQSFEIDTFSPVSSGLSGVHVYGVSGSFAYHTQNSLVGLTGVVPGSSQSRPAIGQASASIGWSGRGESWEASGYYSPSFARSFNVTGYQSLNHLFNFYASRKVRPKWTLTAATQGIASDFSQLLFSPTTAGRLSSVQATFDDLVSALLGSGPAGPLSAVAGAAPVTASPEAAYLFGARILSIGGSASLTYQRSTRSTFSGSFSAVQTQFLNDRNSSNPIADQYTAQQLKSTAVIGNLTWSYALTPRTTTGVTFTSSRALSDIQDGNTIHATAFAGRKVTTNLFLRGSVGAGRYLPGHGVLTNALSQHEFGGGVGYKIFSHTVVASFDRSTSDLYGLGAEATMTGSGGWNWHRPGSSLSIAGLLGYSEFQGSRFANSGSWTASIMVARALDRHSVISVAYRYMQYPLQLFVFGPDRTQSGIMVTFSWSPSERQARDPGHPASDKEEGGR